MLHIPFVVYLWRLFEENFYLKMFHLNTTRKFVSGNLQKIENRND